MVKVYENRSSNDSKRFHFGQIPMVTRKPPCFKQLRGQIANTEDAGKLEAVATFTSLGDVVPPSWSYREDYFLGEVSINPAEKDAQVESLRVEEMIQRKAEKQSKLLEMVRKRVQKQTQKLRKDSFLNSQNEEFLEAEIGPESETEPALFSLDLLHQKEKQSMEELKRLFHHREVANPIESDRKSPFCYTEGYFYLENHEFHQGKNLEYNSANNLSDDECVENSKSKDCTDRVCESKEDHPNFSCIRAGKKDAKIRKAPETIPSQTRIENERYRQALITNLKQRARRRKMPIPTVCSCQKSSSDWKTFTCKLCAENCLFYKQPKYYTKYLAKMLEACGLS